MLASILLVCSASGAIVFAWLIRWYHSVTTRLAGVPGPRPPSYIVGSARELAKAPMGTKMKMWTKKYGQTYKIRGALMEPVLILGDPRGATHVLQGKNYVRPDFDRIVLELFFGARNLFSTEGDEHRNMRKYLNPAFTLQSVQEVSPIFFELADKLKQEWLDILDGHESSDIDIAPFLHMLSLDAITMTMFMHNLSADQSNKIPAVIHEMSSLPKGDFSSILLETFASHFPFVLNLPSPLKTYGSTLQTEFGKIARDVWEGKEAGGMHAKVVEALLQARTNREPLNLGEIIAQTIGVLFAGSETSANVISECLYELSRNPSIQQKLRDEISHFRSTNGKEPAFEDLTNPNAFPYLDAVVRETLRTKAVLREISRTAVHDDIIPLQFPVSTTGKKEVHVKAGQLIQIPIRDGINADEAIWGADAAEFKPERWIEPAGLPPSVESIHAQGRTLTFGDGPKACLGRVFAIAEIKIIVSSLVSHFAFEDSGVVVDFYHLGGNTVKPLVRGREVDGVQLPLRIRALP